MFGLSLWEIGLIMAVALLVLGPKKLPELAKKLGEAMREFRSATDSFKDTVQGELYKPPQAPPSAAPNAERADSSVADIVPPVPAALPETAGVTEAEIEPADSDASAKTPEPANS